MNVPLPIVEFLTRCQVKDTGDQALATMDAFQALIEEANRVTNLTRILSPEDFWTKHVADSVALALVLPEIAVQPWHIVDVGCGAGVPMIPLAWAFPNLRLPGIESRHRKAEFVEQAARHLGLHNCAVVARQAREAARLPELAGAFDGVVMRAVGDTEWLLEEALPFVRRGIGTWMALYKTPAAVSEELSVARRAAGRCGFRVTASEEFDLPLAAGRRQFLLLQRA